MTTMIERVARKLCERDGGDPDEIRHGEGKAIGQTWTGWQAYASDAREIVGLMRGPTEAMIKAGDAWQMNSSDADGIYDAMLQAAFEEGENT